MMPALRFAVHAGLLAVATLIAGWLIADPTGRAACEQRHSGATCNHILRG